VNRRLNSWLRAHRVCNVCDSTSSGGCVSLYAQSLVTEGMVNQCHAKSYEFTLLVRDCIASDSDSVHSHARINGSLSNIVIMGTFQKEKKITTEIPWPPEQWLFLKTMLAPRLIARQSSYIYLANIPCFRELILDLVHNNTVLNGEVFCACIKAISVMTCSKSITVGIWLVTESCEMIREREWKQIYDLDLQLSMVSESITRGAGLETE